MAIATSSVDRLAQIPARLGQLFQFDAEHALADPHVRDEMQADAAQRVVRALAAALANAPRLDRERFRQVAQAIKEQTGQKGRQLFHPIRVALTGAVEGPELDLLIPAIDRGADLPASAGLPAIIGCRERAAVFLRALDGR
jgi:glutamyl-tRNA synthetase/nondiscriminating glutamyl-tRNA synthetase